IVAFEEELFPAAPSRTGGCGLQFRPPASSAAPRRSTTNARAQMAATQPSDGRRAHRPYLESRRTTFVSRPSFQGLKPVSRLRGTAPRRERRQTMPQFFQDGKAYWGGMHRELGLLIYDPHGQQRLAADKVRL